MTFNNDDFETRVENRIIEMLEETKDMPLGRSEDHVTLGLNIAINVIRSMQMSRKKMALLEEIKTLKEEIAFQEAIAAGLKEPSESGSPE